MVDYIYFKTSFQLCKQKLKWFVLSPVFNSAIKVLTLFQIVSLKRGKKWDPEIMTEAKASLAQVMPDC